MDMVETPPEIPEPPEAPDWIKTVHWVQHHLRTNWEALVKPPVLIVICLMAVAAYEFGASRESDMMDVKNERISFLNDQLGAYKDRLNGATPDEAAKQFTSLQSEVEAYMRKFDALFPEGPRKLNQDQLKILALHKDDMLKFGKTLEVYSGEIGDSTAYATDFLNFFKSQKIPTTGPINVPCYVGERGVLVGLKDPSKPSSNATTFLKILKAADVNPNTTTWGAPISPDTLDFDLYICPPF